MKFIKHKLGELLRITRGASLPGTGYADEGRYLRLTLANFHEEGGFKDFKSTQGKYFIEPFDSRFLMHKGDLITPLTEQSPGLLGSVAFIPCDDLYIQSQDVGLITCNTEKIDKTFAYYLFLTHSVREQISARSQQTKIRHTSPDKIADVEVHIPDLPTQLRIAGVLGSIDEKIELNRKKIAELEALAKTIYDYWFVQFDFPDKNGKPYKSSGGKMVYNEKLKREIPEGWEDSILSEIANITMGQSPDGSSYNEEGNGSVFYQGSTDFGIRFPSVRMFTTEPSRFAEKGDILMSVRAPVGDTNIANKDCCIGRGLAALNSKIGSITYLYFILDYLKAKFDLLNSVGTTFGAITKDELFTLPVIKPDDDVLKCFENICSPIFDKQMNIGFEINELTRLRDSLLPMLMNGQVTVE